MAENYGWEKPDLDNNSIKLKLPPKGTPNKVYAQIFEESFPALWKRMNVKQYDAPGNYCGWRLPATAFCSTILECIQKQSPVTPVARNCAANVGILEKYNFPTYYVGKELLEALLHTNTPKERTWEDISWPFPAMIFMLPIGVLKDTSYNSSINFVVVANKPKGDYPIPGLSNTKAVVKLDSVSIFWSSEDGTSLQDVTIKSSNPLTPSVDYLQAASDEFRNKIDYPLMEPCDAEFSCYMMGLVANLMLVMQARKELVEPDDHPIRTLKSGLNMHRPRWIGRNYKYVRPKPRPNATGAHFTELDWRAGYTGTYHVGVGRTQILTKWVEPYLAYTSGLVKAGETRND